MKYLGIKVSSQLIDMEFVCRAIDSCQTLKQLTTTKKLTELFVEKHRDKLVSSYVTYIMGSYALKYAKLIVEEAIDNS